MDITTLLRDFGVFVSESREDQDGIEGNLSQSASAESWLFPLFKEASYFSDRSFYYLYISKSTNVKYDYNVELLRKNILNSEEAYQTARAWLYIPQNAQRVYVSPTGNYKNFKPGVTISKKHLIETFADTLPEQHYLKQRLISIGQAFRENRVSISTNAISDNDIITLELEVDGKRDILINDPACQKQIVKNVYEITDKGTCSMCGQEDVELIQGGSSYWKLFSTTRKTNALSFNRCLSCDIAISIAEKFIETHTLAVNNKTKAQNACIFIPATARKKIHTNLWFQPEKTRSFQKTMERLIKLLDKVDAVYAMHVVFMKSNAGINLLNAGVERIDCSVMVRLKSAMTQVNRIVPSPEKSISTFNYWQINGIETMLFRLLQGKTDFPLERLSSMLRLNEYPGGKGFLVWLELLYLMIQKGAEFMSNFTQTSEFILGRIFRLALRLDYIASNGNSKLKAMFINPRYQQLETIKRESLKKIYQLDLIMHPDERIELSDMIDFLNNTENSSALTENQRMIAFLAGTQKMSKTELKKLKEKLLKTEQSVTTESEKQELMEGLEAE